MKKLILIISTLVSITTHAQTIVNKTDEFTGQHSKSAVVFFGKKAFGNPLLGPLTPSLTFTQINDKTIMYFNFPGFNTQLNSSQEINIKNCSILLKMEGDSILRFRADTLLSSIIHNGFAYNVGIGATLNEQQVAYLMNNKIKIFRLGVSGDNGADMDLLTEKNKREIQKSAMYMLGMKEVEDQ